MLTMGTQPLRLWEACSAMAITAFLFLSKWPRVALLTHVRESEQLPQFLCELS